MTLIRHDPATVNRPVGNYSHAIEVPAGTGMLYISGQVPELPDGSVPDGFEAQCEAVWDNVIAALAAAGLGPKDLVKVTTFLTHRDQAETNSLVRRRRLGDTRPALTVIVVQTLSSAWLLEIEAVAAVSPKRDTP